MVVDSFSLVFFEKVIFFAIFTPWFILEYTVNSSKSLIFCFIISFFWLSASFSLLVMSLLFVKFSLLVLLSSYIIALYSSLLVLFIFSFLFWINLVNFCALFLISIELLLSIFKLYLLNSSITIFFIFR